MQERQEMQVQSLGQEDPLEKGMATHFSILAWRIPRTEKPGRLQSKGSRRVRHSWSDLACTGICSTIFFNMHIISDIQFYDFLLAFLFLKIFGQAAWHVGSWFPNQEQSLCPFKWKYSVSTTGPPGNPLWPYISLNISLLQILSSADMIIYI